MPTLVAYISVTRFRLGCEACGAWVECKPEEIRPLGGWWHSHRNPRWAIEYRINGGTQRWSAGPPELVTCVSG